MNAIENFYEYDNTRFLLAMAYKVMLAVNRKRVVITVMLE